MRPDFVRNNAAKAAKIRRRKRQSKKNFVVYDIYKQLLIEKNPYLVYDIIHESERLKNPYL